VLCSNGTDRHLVRLGEILKQFQALGVAEWLPENVCRGRPVTVDDYQQCCVALQSSRLRKFRHFLFVTGDHADFCRITYTLVTVKLSVVRAAW
jgi:hypothetical protein